MSLMKNEKVFCFACKHYTTGETSDDKLRCNKFPVIRVDKEDTPIYPETTTTFKGNCMELNKDNHCKGYEGKPIMRKMEL